jgi:NitT/TauT family transport system permease protein
MILIRALRFALLIALLGIWHVLTDLDILPIYIFGRPLGVAQQLWSWFSTGYILEHLITTLTETMLAFLIGTLLGLVFGLWLGLSDLAAQVLDPFLKAVNSMPRIVLGPIFAVWFGLGIWSKVALGVTIVFFLVFFNVFQGVREVSPTVLSNARMLAPIAANC